MLNNDKTDNNNRSNNDDNNHNNSVNSNDDSFLCAGKRYTVAGALHQVPESTTMVLALTSSSLQSLPSLASQT